MSYEEERQKNISRNKALLAELNLKHESATKPLPLGLSGHSKARGGIVKRKITREAPAPTRISARLKDESRPRPTYNEDKLSKDASVITTSSTRRRKGKTSGTKGVKLEDLDTNESETNEADLPPADISSLVSGWNSWLPTGEAPIRDDEGAFHFGDAPSFTPNKSPAEVLREGAFGGGYYRPIRSRKLGLVVQDDWKDLPEEWIEGLNVERFLTSSDYDPDVNKFKVSCGQTIEEWEAAGWIRHEHDVRGWFQWYARFFQGRRCEDDDRQISRWRKCVGETGRWRRMLLKKYGQAGVRTVFDDGEDEDAPEVSPVMHQTCHHWAFEVRQEVLDAFWAAGAK